jgi:hypothetical protein
MGFNFAFKGLIEISTTQRNLIPATYNLDDLTRAE